jgi:four helix bundle protein
VNALSISKGETGELKSQLYRCPDDQHISPEEFQEFYRNAEIVAKKIASFIIYLNSAPHKGQKFKNRS